jgi:cyclic pyranopterin phosphate synthase
MVDVGEKAVVRRTATAAGSVRMAPATVELLREKALPKGDALNTARIAGVMAAKRTPDLIPLCHGLNLTAVDVEFEVRQAEIGVVATARASDRTGVEMEALTAAATAALALYDMVKGVQRDVRVEDLRLLAKRGGRSGEYVAPGGVRGTSGEVPR